MDFSLSCLGKDAGVKEKLLRRAARVIREGWGGEGPTERFHTFGDLLATGVWGRAGEH